MLKIALTVTAVWLCMFLVVADIAEASIGENSAGSHSLMHDVVKRDTDSANKQKPIAKKRARNGKKCVKGNKKCKDRKRNRAQKRSGRRKNGKGKGKVKGKGQKRNSKPKGARNGKKNGKKKKCEKGDKDCKKRRRNRKRNGQQKKECRKGDKNCKKGKNGKNKNNPLGKKSGRAGKRNNCTNKKKKACRNKDGCKWTKNGCKTKIRSVGKRNQDRQNSTLPSCFSKMFKYASKYKKAGNIFRQVKRTEGNKDKIEKKGKKKGDFNSTLMTLTSALGGNKTAPKCPGNSTASRQFADTLTLLDKCEADIDTACKFPNVTIKTDCKDAAQKFLNDTDKCLKPSLSDADACSCFDALDLDATLAIIDGCSTKADNDAVLAEKNKCKSKFAECKKAEDSSVGLVNTCKEQLKCGGVATKEEGEKQLKALTPLSDALKQTGFADALDRLGLTSGDGADGKLPNATRNGMRLRFTRQTEDALCTGVLDKWKSFNSSGNAALPDGVNGDVNEAETTNTVNILNDLNQDDKLDEKLNSCQKETRQGVAVLVIVEIRFFVFWCGWWQITIVEVKITIISVAIGVPPPPPITQAPSPPAVSTSSPGRNLKKLVKKHLN